MPLERLVLLLGGVEFFGDLVALAARSEGGAWASSSRFAISIRMID